MRVYIANFGKENYEWPVCRERSTIATMNEIDLQSLWAANDRAGYIQLSMTKKTAAGITPPRPVASRWFNLMTIVAETANDVWIHRAKEEFWWTISRRDPPEFEEKIKPIARGEKVIVCHKPCQPWSDRNRVGNKLQWNALHPRAREFLFTEGTLQELSTDNAAYAVALLDGADLEPWHSRLDWRRKLTTRMGKAGAGKIFNGRERAISRMAQQAFATAAVANGQQVTKTMKEKKVVGFASPYELESYIKQIMDAQEDLCAITDLRLQADGEEDDEQMLPSLDRIDSNRHYERENLQVVCRFINRWKSDEDDKEFRRLIGLVRSLAGPERFSLHESKSSLLASSSI